MVRIAVPKYFLIVCLRVPLYMISHNFPQLNRILGHLQNGNLLPR